MTILGVARNAAKQQQAIQDRMSETFLTNDFLPNFAFSSIPMTINVQGSKKLLVLFICLAFFSFLFMRAPSKYRQQSRRDQCAVYNHWVISAISWLSWSCQEKSLSGHKIDLYLPPSPPPSLSTGVGWFVHFTTFGDLIRELLQLQLVFSTPLLKVRWSIVAV